MHESVARSVLDALTAANGSLQAAIANLGDPPSDTSDLETRRRIAMIISLIGTGLYKPIYHQHPSLCPQVMKFMLDRPPTRADWPFGPDEA